MNDHQTNNFAEQASTWLFGLEFVVYVVTGLMILFVQFSAYKRLRTRALLLLVISSGLALFVIIFDYTIGQKGAPDPTDWWQYYFGREIVWMTAAVVGTVGTLMFIRDYIQLATVVPNQATAAVPTSAQSTHEHDRNA